MDEKYTERDYQDTKAHKGFNKHFDIHAPVFWPSAILVVFFITLTLIVSKPMGAVFDTVQSTLSDYAGWFYILCVNIFLFFVLYLAFSRTDQAGWEGGET